jgi:NAD(P)H-dependent FMN reductase
MTKIKIIAGSVRPGRFNIQAANWIYEQAQKHGGAEFELVDLEKVNLPIYDEPHPAMRHQYEHDHTKKWAEVIGDADGFIFVTPEYNHSFAPSLGNAISFLNLEWNYKPVSFVSYGSLAGGARAVEHLRGVAGELRMFDMREQVLIPNYYMNLDDQGQYKFGDAEVQQAGALLDELVTWTGKIKTAREA